MDDISIKYNKYAIPKKNGSKRFILEPSEELKEKQNELLKKLYRIFVSPYAHGGVPNRSIVTNAYYHVGKKYIMQIDLKDFFPSITRDKFFKKISINDLGIELYNEVYKYCFYYDEYYKDYILPQGAITSPVLTNIYMRNLDWWIAKYMKKREITYTRYFDDLTFSTNRENGNKYMYILYEKFLIPKLTKYELFVNYDKFRIKSNSRKQEVCGVIVNKKLNVDKKYRMNLRAEIYQQKQKGLQLSKETLGKISFVNMIRNFNKQYLYNRKYYYDYMID